jgi:hypothetical protein
MEDRRQLNLLLERSQFADGEQVTSIIDRHTAVETEGMTALRQHDYDETVRLLVAKHKSELEGFGARAEVQIAQLLQNRARERLILENREKKVEKRGQVASNKERIWALEQGRLHEKLSRDVRLSQGFSKASPRSARIVSHIEKDAEISIPRETTIPLPPLVKAKRPKTLYPAT